MFKDLLIKEELENPKVNWIITFAMIGIIIGFIIFGVMTLFKAFVPALIVVGVLAVVGAIAGIPVQITKKKRS